MKSEIAHLNKQVDKLKVKVKSYEKILVELKQRSDIQDTLNEILNISLMPISMNEQMEKILLIILSIDWLSLEEKGCVFLTDNTGHGLKMVAHHNLEESLLSLCDHIQFGQCLCGIAAQEQNLIFRDCIDKDHHIMPTGMNPHGHYNMPIISNGKTLGVLNLYVKHGHNSSNLEQNFLKSCSKAMASIIERKKIEEKLHKLSYLDELTGIPNRRQFMNYLDDVIKDAEKYQRIFSVLFIDLDKFKVVNDTCGHECGDKLLIEVSQRIQLSLRDTDVVARLGGDEFVVILEVVPTAEKAIEIANLLIQEISKPYSIDDHTPVIGASIGVSMFPEHDSHAEGILRKADKALYDAKENRGMAVIYSK
ncbi:MAG: GGDEF domain-containing protein [Gammaproteobacteria bacterium]|nr:GGDEF domain-containing protein [Gammaproteobacteria bacterium]